jgi:hypothetical protein
MKRTSKYVGKLFDNGWMCTHIGVARVQPKKKVKGHGLSKRAGHQTYYYIMERRTSDDKADKMIRLSAQEAANVYRGAVKVETILEAREGKQASKFTSKISYHFD